MRTRFAASIAQPDGEEFLTTGEVATMLGVSRQHVVDLCTAGDMPFTLIGKHRRIRRSDVETFVGGSQRQTKDQVRSLLLAHAVAAHLVTDPGPTLARARQNLLRMRNSSAKGSARVWIDEWARLLEAPIPELLERLTSTSQRSRELRQNSPFAGVLSEEERARIRSTSAFKEGAQ